jgi:chitinase
VDRYDVSAIDLDVEGAGLADNAAATRRALAIAAVQKSRPADRPLSVWLTLPLARDGLTDQGRGAVSAMLGAGVDLAGVNGMAFDFGSQSGDGIVSTISTSVVDLHDQVGTLYRNAGVSLDDQGAWSRTGATVMIGQTDVADERLTIQDAAGVNDFARTHRLGQLSMWSLNRDSTCQYPLPTVIVVVQTSCSGVDEQGQTFAQVLGDGLRTPVSTDGATSTASPVPSTSIASPAPEVTDNPATSPYPIWDPLTIYVTGMRVVWKQAVYEAAFYSTGIPPGVSVAQGSGDPWRLIGPVLPGDTPAPSPSVPVGTYPQWSGSATYNGGDRVLVGTTAYVARYWTKGDRPGVPMVGGSPWRLLDTSAG